MTDHTTARTHSLHVVEARAAGLDVHKLQLTATTLLCEPGGGDPLSATRAFRTTPAGLAAMTAWLRQQGVAAVAMEGTGIYWEPPYEALESAGLRISLLHAQQVKQLRGKKTDFKDSQWLARVCQFGIGTPSYIPPLAFRELRGMTRNRRKLVADRSRARNRIHKLLDRNGLQLGGVLSDIFGLNGRRVLDGLVAQQPPETILAGLTRHVRPKLEPLAETLAATLDAESLCQLRGHLLRPCQPANRGPGSPHRPGARRLAQPTGPAPDHPGHRPAQRLRDPGRDRPHAGAGLPRRGAPRRLGRRLPGQQHLRR